MRQGVSANLCDLSALPKEVGGEYVLSRYATVLKRVMQDRLTALKEHTLSRRFTEALHTPSKRPPVSLTLIFLSLAFGISFLALMMTANGITTNVQKELLRHALKSLVIEGQLAQKAMIPILQNKKDSRELHDAVTDYASDIPWRFTLISNSGVALGDTHRTWNDLLKMKTLAQEPEVARALKGGVGTHIRRSEELAMDMVYVARPISQQNSILGVVRLGMPLDVLFERLQKVEWKKNVFLGIWFFVFVIAYCVMARILWSRSQRIFKALDRYAADEFVETISMTGNDEFTRMSVVLNYMAGVIRKRSQVFSEEREKLQFVLQSSIEGIIMLSEELVIQEMNPACEKILQVQSHAWIGKSWTTLSGLGDMQNDLKQNIREKKITVQRIEWKNNDIHKDLLVISGGMGILSYSTRAIVLIQDLSELEQLKEFRNNTIYNLSKNLNDFTHQSDGLGKIAKNMQLLVQGLEQKVHMKLEMIRFPELVGQVLENHQEIIRQKNLKIKTNFSTGAEVYILGSREYLLVLLANLLDNACRYSKEKGAIRFADAIDKDKYIFELSNETSYALSSQEKSLLGVPFFQGEKAAHEEKGSVGLGLPAALHVMRAHDAHAEFDIDDRVFKIRLIFDAQYLQKSENVSDVDIKNDENQKIPIDKED